MLPEAILCDAHLDYLGRDDYTPISRSLLSEWLSFGHLTDVAQWPSIERSFLANHAYFTSENQQLREARKQQTLAVLSPV